MASLLNNIWYAFNLSLIWAVFCGSIAFAEWGSITIQDDSFGHKAVTLENNSLRVKFYKDPRSWGGWIGFQPYCIKEFYLKSIAQDLEYGSRARFNDDMAKDFINKATVINNGTDRKTVLLEYGYDQCAVGQGAAAGVTWCGENREYVTLFQGAPVIKIVYHKWSLFVVDYNEWPAGEKKKVFYGEDSWPKTHDPNDPQGRHLALGEHKPYYYHGGEDPGPLAYKGHLIFGEFMPDGKGYGRVTRPSYISGTGLKLWDNGWEIFNTGTPTYYLFGVDGGKEEILSLGKAIVDFAVSGEQGKILESSSVSQPGHSRSVAPKVNIGGTAKSLVISLDQTPIHDVKIMQVDGKTLLQMRGKGKNSIRINRGILKSGLYVVAIRDTEGKIHATKLANL